MTHAELRDLLVARVYGAVDTPEEVARDVRLTQNRFRRCYLGNGRSMSLCRCMAHVEPHLHAPQKRKRLGHLPMLTVKELPE